MVAGRLMLERIRSLAQMRASFAFETTLASRSFVRLIAKMQQAGYRAHLLFLALGNADLAVQRVAERVKLGGHTVPEATIRRRYTAGLHNLFGLYLPLVDLWQVYDNSRGPRCW